MQKINWNETVWVMPNVAGGVIVHQSIWQIKWIKGDFIELPLHVLMREMGNPPGSRAYYYGGNIFLVEPTAEVLWKMLGDVPVNDDENIEEAFLHFEAGTHREDIWHWFEDAFDVSVASLMKLDV